MNRSDMDNQTDQIDQIVAPAKAVQEIAKTARNAIDAAREAGGFIARFVSGPLEQGMGIFEDKLKYMRWERQVRLMQKAEELLRSLNLSAPTRAVPLKIAIPLFQAASIEDDNFLQDKWAILLVNAANAESGIEVRRAFVEILEQISPLEAKILDVVYSLPFKETQHDGIFASDLPNSARRYTEKGNREDGLEPSDEVKLAIANLARVGCLKPGMSWGGGERFQKINPTILGKEFVQACRIKQA